MRGLAVLVLSLASIAPTAQAPAPPDTILVNAHIVTVDARLPIAQAVEISGGRSTAVGTDAAIRKLAGPSTTTVDLHGQALIPGLADDHLHDADQKISRNQALQVETINNAYLTFEERTKGSIELCRKVHRADGGCDDDGRRKSRV